MILNCYEGGKTKVIHEVQKSIEELKSTGEDPEMLGLLTDLAAQLKDCTNREYFQAKKEALIDLASDIDVMKVVDVSVDE